MLNCISTRLNLLLRDPRAVARDGKSRAHAEGCTRCRELLIPALAADTLLDTLKDSTPCETPADFYTGIQRRIRLLQAEARSEAQTEWEVVVLQFQRTILSGAAAAALCVGLLAYAQSGSQSQSPQRETALESYISPTQGDRMLITRSEPISQDDVLFALVSEVAEDPDNARK